VHFVDEHYDRGPIIAQWPVSVRPDDTPASLSQRVLAVEHALYPRVVQALAAGRVRLDAAGRVRFDAPALDAPFVPGDADALGRALDLLL
jgi:folate-dependent phosphoribosylglycinamide formyltransferase PurN